MHGYGGQRLWFVQIIKTLSSGPVNVSLIMVNVSLILLIKTVMYLVNHSI